MKRIGTGLLIVLGALTAALDATIHSLTGEGGGGMTLNSGGNIGGSGLLILRIHKWFKP